MGKPRKLPEDYRLLAESRGFVWVGSVVTSSKTKTEWQCSKGHRWKAKYNTIQQDVGCPYCAGNYRLTAERFYDLANERGFKWVGNVIVNSQAKTTWECSQGHLWEAKYNSIQQGSSCPRCTGREPLSLASFLDLAKERGFKWMGSEVVDNSTKTVWGCSKGHQWSAAYGNIQQDSGCPSCAGLRPKMSEDYRLLANYRGFVWVESSINNIKSKSNWKCSKGHKWQATYNDIQQGSGCPRCASCISKPEIQLREAIKNMYPDTKGNVRKLLRNKLFELDIYIPSLKKAVEYDGWAHSYYPEQQARDNIKNKQCEEAGIKLLRIPHKEYKQNPEATTQKALSWLSTS